MAAVYEVEDARTRRARALKVMLPRLAGDSEMVERFALEVRIPARLDCDHVADVIDAGLDAASGCPFLVMELLSGEDLGATLARGPLPFDEVMRWVDDVAAALDAAHEAGVVHRDIKPENLFLAQRDGRTSVKILDFGVAKLVAEDVKAAGTTRALGTPLYMAPEQAEGDGTIDGRADGYSLAHVAYALLTGAPYWKDESGLRPLALARAMDHGPAETARARALRRGIDLPGGIDGWFERAAHPDRRKRFTTATELAAGLRRALTDHGASPARPARGRMALLIVASAVALFSAALFGRRPPSGGPAEAHEERPEPKGSIATPAVSTPGSETPLRAAEANDPETPGHQPIGDRVVPAGAPSHAVRRRTVSAPARAVTVRAPASSAPASSADPTDLR